ncbi:MAG: glycerophosphodiester phosphodiesterase [Deltaproteobacteria bacterium]|nr:glycerophosphodiester phosphodiesterase [Deltaproteobacteria bacterium]
MLIGHRGAAGLYPENTLSGFERALDLGVDGIELDVMMTADGVLCVHHDYRLNPGTARTSEKQWLNSQANIPIKSLTFKTLNTYDVGRLKPHTEYAGKFPDQRPIDGERIPALREVIALLKNRGDEQTKMWIEIKISPEHPDMTPPLKIVVKQVLKTLHDEGFEDRALLLSFNWSVLALVKKMVPRMPTAYLSVTAKWLDTIKPGQPGPSPWTGDINLDDYQGSIPHGIHAAGGKIWCAWFKRLTEKEVRTAHDLGLKVFAWFVDSIGDIEKFINMDVDGIITNRPDRAKRLLDRA